MFGAEATTRIVPVRLGRTMTFATPFDAAVTVFLTPGPRKVTRRGRAGSARVPSAFRAVTTIVSMRERVATGVP
jgi:hypothetical protein